MEYTVNPSNPPDLLVDGWEALLSDFGTEPFSQRLAEDTLLREYPYIPLTSIQGLLKVYAEKGGLTVHEGDF